jgi:hypothetical protein
VSEMIEWAPLPVGWGGDQVDAVASRYMRKRMNRVGEGGRGWAIEWTPLPVGGCGDQMDAVANR